MIDMIVVVNWSANATPSVANDPPGSILAWAFATSPNDCEQLLTSSTTDGCRIASRASG